MIEEKPLLQSYAGKALKVADVATILNVSESTVRKMLREGTLEGVEIRTRIGGRPIWRIRGRSIDALLNNQEAAS